jgi:hypothetical protein
MYDFTAGALKAYFQSRKGGPIHRHLRHASNSSTWDTAWTDDGEVTYPWPSLANIQQPVTQTISSIMYIYHGGELDDGGSWALQKQLRARKDTTTTIAMIEECRMDWSDIPGGDWFSAAPIVYKDGEYWYGLQTRQHPIGGDAYEFSIYIMRSVDGLHFSTPIPVPELVPNGDSSSWEYRGCGFPTVSSDGSSIFYCSTKRYTLGATNAIWLVPSRRDIVRSGRRAMLLDDGISVRRRMCG